MKSVLVDACNHFDNAKSTCSKCGRSLPDVCLEFEQMKQKAEAYDRSTELPRAPVDSDVGDIVPPVKRGRPKKVTNETNATD